MYLSVRLGNRGWNSKGVLHVVVRGNQRAKPCRRPLSLITYYSSCSQVSKELGIQLFAMLVQNGL
jgi:hypothetical protein